MVRIKPFSCPFQDLYRDMVEHYAIVAVTPEGVQPLCIKESKKEIERLAELLADLVGISVVDESSPDQVSSPVRRRQ